jgi:hypothetical protein
MIRVRSRISLDMVSVLVKVIEVGGSARRGRNMG